jgi:hypothetical protein
MLRPNKLYLYGPKRQLVIDPFTVQKSRSSCHLTLIVELSSTGLMTLELSICTSRLNVTISTLAVMKMFGSTTVIPIPDRTQRPAEVAKELPMVSD